MQGTKLGGPWLIPMVGLAALIGLRHDRALDRWRGRVAELARRGAMLIGISLAALFVSTPYAFISPDFLIMTRQVVRYVD